MKREDDRPIARAVRTGLLMIVWFVMVSAADFGY